MRYSLKYHAHSEVGRIRKNNQDSGYASPTLLLVADGMGGAAAGDLASAVVATEAKQRDRTLVGEEMLEFLGGLLHRANDKLRDLIDDDPTVDGMGTTFCGAAFDGTHLGVAHIGDSRLYRLREGKLEQLTHDHSWVQNLIDEGRITPDEALRHPHRSLILKVLNGQTEPDPDYLMLEVAEADRYLFCSDGLSGLIDDSHLEAVLQGVTDLTECASMLAEDANAAGGHDNITIVMADIVAYDDALAAAQPIVVGSATEREIPALGARVSTRPGQGYPEVVDDPDPDHDSEEKARYAPEGSPRRWPTLLLAAALVLVMVGGSVWGVIAYAGSRYYIAETDGHVGIFNGLPGSLLGYELNHLEERRETRITDLPRFYQRAVGNTIGSASLSAARETADNLQTLAQQCVAVREARRNPPTTPSPVVTPTPTGTASSGALTPSPTSTDPSGSPTPSPSSSTLPTGLSTGNPNYPTVLAPVTPTATEEADPEAC